MTNSKPIVVLARRLPAAVEREIATRYDARFNESDVAMSSAQLADALMMADALIPTVSDKISAEMLSRPGVRVRAIINYGVGYNNINCDAARAAGIIVTNTPDVLTDDTADIGLALILMSMRRLGEGERQVRAGGWTGWHPTHLNGQSLRGKTLGIVGFGRIGRALAKRAALALGMHIVWFDSYIPANYDGHQGTPEGGRRIDSVEELLRISDVVSLHCPSTPETHHLMNAERIAMMKPTAVLVNTARGDVVDEGALIDALERKVIFGAGLDVFEFEPALSPAMCALENVVMLPHLGSNGIETRTAMGNVALANLDAFFAGAAPPNRVA